MRAWSVGRTSIVIASSIMGLALVAACGTSGSTGGSATGAGPTAGATASPTASNTQPTGATGTASVPSSCAQVPIALIRQYLPGATLAQSLGPVARGVSCEFVGSSAASILILNVGSGGTAAAFTALRTGSGGGGRTTTDVTGLGASAFSISKNGKVAGVDAITSQGVVISVGSTLTLAQDEQLIAQLIALY
jgi:hypothetical protein